MALIQDGAGSGNLLLVNDNKAARVTLIPTPVINMETFSLQSGALTGAAANSTIFSLRNGGANLLAVRKLLLNVVATTGFTAAQLVDFAAYIARSFTVADSGGNGATLTGNNNKHRASQTTISSSVDLRIAAAGALTNGTRTPDANPIGSVGGWALAATAGVLVTKIPLIDIKDGLYPIILANNEGIIVNNLTALGAAGVLKLYADVELAEIDPTKFTI